MRLLKTQRMTWCQTNWEKFCEVMRPIPRPPPGWSGQILPYDRQVEIMMIAHQRKKRRKQRIKRQLKRDQKKAKEEKARDRENQVHSGTNKNPGCFQKLVSSVRNKIYPPDTPPRPNSTILGSFSAQSSFRSHLSIYSEFGGNSEHEDRLPRLQSQMKPSDSVSCTNLAALSFQRPSATSRPSGFGPPNQLARKSSLTKNVTLATKPSLGTLGIQHHLNEDLDPDLCGERGWTRGPTDSIVQVIALYFCKFKKSKSYFYVGTNTFIFA